MIKISYHMACGCILNKKQLIVNEASLSCPEHLMGIDCVKRPCSRCGVILESRAWNSKKVFCEECYRMLSLARTIYSYHNIKTIFVDPILWRKGLDEIGEDMCINARFGKEIIQVDIPMEVQHEQKTVVIDIEQKLQILKERVLCQVSQELN